mgnify:CR=1 FL=1
MPAQPVVVDAPLPFTEVDLTGQGLDDDDIAARAQARPRPTAKEDHVEAPVISGIAHDRSQDKITLVGVPDVPGAAARPPGPDHDQEHS